MLSAGNPLTTSLSQSFNLAGDLARRTKVAFVYPRCKGYAEDGLNDLRSRSYAYAAGDAETSRDGEATASKVNEAGSQHEGLFGSSFHIFISLTECDSI